MVAGMTESIKDVARDALMVEDDSGLMWPLARWILALPDGGDVPSAEEAEQMSATLHDWASHYGWSGGNEREPCESEYRAWRAVLALHAQVATERVAREAAEARVRELDEECDRQRADANRLHAWLRHIEGGDSPCRDESQLRQWAYEATTLERDAP